MFVHLLVLNYNGRDLLPQCLPSVLQAADASRHRCRTIVIDNDSSDDSLSVMAEQFPQVKVIRRPNRGLCSFNDVLAELDGRVALLLNNDIKLHEDSIDPLVAPLESTPSCFMTAPLCWAFDGSTYEGFRTAVRWRWGLIQATALYPGHEGAIGQAGPTASAGAAMAVDRAKFNELGGFDPSYLPGRLEDLDFAFRGYMAGYHALYVPQAVAYHRGMATFAEEFGRDGCQRLALRNTLLLQWKNLRHPLHVVRQLSALPVRLAVDLLRAPLVPRAQRWMFTGALLAAIARLGQLSPASRKPTATAAREMSFFRQFHPRKMIAATVGVTTKGMSS